MVQCGRTETMDLMCKCILMYVQYFCRQDSIFEMDYTTNDGAKLQAGMSGCL